MANGRVILCGCACVFTIVFIVFGFLGLFFLPVYVHSQIADLVKLTPNGDLYKLWQDPTSNGAKTYYAIYFFNLTNADAVTYHGATPKFEELGPYTYQEIKVKNLDNITWNNKEGTVEFTYHTSYTFLPDLSKMANGRQLSEGDNITTIHLGIFGIYNVVKNMDNVTFAQAMSYMNFYAHYQLHMTSPFITHNLSSLVWGYTDPLMGELHRKAPGQVPADVNVFYKDDPTTYYAKSSQYTGNGGHATGFSDGDSIMMFKKWEGMEKLNFWGDDEANTIKGTDGTQFHPFLEDNEELYAFVDSLSRSAQLGYDKDTDLHGVHLKSFTITQSALASGAKNPKNNAYFMSQTGFLPLVTASGPAPVNVTKAHFLDCDLTNVNVEIDGHNPPLANKADHDTHLDIEPLTGAVFAAQKRLQLNAFMQPLKYPGWNPGEVDTLLMTKNLTTTWFPVLYVNEYGAADSGTCQDFIDQLYRPLLLGFYGGISFVVVGFLLLCGTCFCAYRIRQHRDEDALPLINEKRVNK